MMKLLWIFFCVTIFCFQTKAQNNSTNITNIKPITKQEFLQLKNSVAGDIVMIKEEGTIYYYSGSQWFAMKGECYPNPVSPKIDSINLVGNKIQIYFNDQNKNFQKYVVSSVELNIEITVTNNPITLDKPKTAGQYNFTIKGKNECGTAGPISSVPIEIKDK